MQRHITKLMAATAVLGLTLAACGSNGGGGGGSTDAMQAKGPINIWYSNNEAGPGIPHMPTRRSTLRKSRPGTSPSSTRRRTAVTTSCPGSPIR